MLKTTLFTLSTIAYFGLSTHNAASLPEEGSDSDLDFAIRQLHRTHTLDLEEALKLQRAASTIKAMSAKERGDFIKSLGAHHKKELQDTLPEERQFSISSCCFAFWSSCTKVSGRALGGLAVDVINDLADGRLDGRGPAGSINYAGNLLNIVTEEIEEFYTTHPTRQ
jgi:hypothetical protein